MKPNMEQNKHGKLTLSKLTVQKLGSIKGGYAQYPTTLSAGDATIFICPTCANCVTIQSCITCHACPEEPIDGLG
jgi:hypothetical protein